LLNKLFNRREQSESADYEDLTNRGLQYLKPLLICILLILDVNVLNLSLSRYIRCCGPIQLVNFGMVKVNQVHHLQHQVINRVINVKSLVRYITSLQVEVVASFII